MSFIKHYYTILAQIKKNVDLIIMKNQNNSQNYIESFQKNNPEFVLSK